MSEMQKQILDTFDRVIPKLSDLDKEKLLAFGEGLGFAVGVEPPKTTNETATMNAAATK